MSSINQLGSILLSRIAQKIILRISFNLNKFAESKILDKLEHFFSDHKFLFSLFINILLFSLFFIFFTPRFAINDDPKMMMIASGELIGEPNEHLIFINVIIGHFLKFMYTAFPLLNWYVLLFYFCHFVAMTVVLYVFLRNNVSAYNLLLYLLLFVFVEVHFLTNLQFTTTAFVLGISGFLLLFSYEDIAFKNKMIWISSGIILLLFSGLIRGPVFYALLLLWFPLIMYRIYLDKSFQRLIPVAIVVILFFFANQYDNYYYNKQPDWNYYSQYNSLRANLTDYPHFEYNEKTEHVYKAVGWSENKVKMFRAWSFADKEVFPLEDLFYIVENINPAFAGIRDMLLILLANVLLSDVRGFLLILIIFIITIMAVHNQDKRFLFIALLMVGIAIIYLLYQGRLIPRVFHPMFYSLFVISLFYLADSKNNIFISGLIRESLKKITYLTLSVIMVFIFFIDAGASLDNKKIQEKIDYNLAKLASDEYIYAIWPCPGMFYPWVYFTYYVPSFSAQSSDSDIETLPFGGSLSYSPHHKKSYSKQSIDNIYLDLVDRDDILLIASQELVKDLLVEFMEENYGISIQFAPVHITADIPTFHIFTIDTE